jgi:hypothetical protein
VLAPQLVKTALDEQTTSLEYLPHGGDRAEHADPLLRARRNDCASEAAQYRHAKANSTDFGPTRSENRSSTDHKICGLFDKTIEGNRIDSVETTACRDEGVGNRSTRHRNYSSHFPVIAAVDQGKHCAHRRKRGPVSTA